MANVKQILSRIAGARIALEKAIALTDVMREAQEADETGLSYVRDELIRVCGRLDSAAGVVENLIYRDASPASKRKRSTGSIIERDV